MNATRKEHLFAKWDAQVGRLLDAMKRLERNHTEVSSGLMRRCLGVEPWDREAFGEWLERRQDASCLAPGNLRQVVAHHEAGHAVFSELLFPGHVTRVSCFREPRDGQFGNAEVDFRDEEEFVLSPTRGIAVLLAGGFFQGQAGSSSELAHHGAGGDRKLIADYFERFSVPKLTRKRYLELAEDVLDRLASSERVCNAVRRVAEILIRDEHVSGERVREIIAAEIGPIDKLLSDLGIPRLELEPSAKAA